VSSVTCASRVSELDAEAHIAQYVTVLAHLLLWAVQRACRRFASGNVTKAECPDWKRAYAPSTAHISPFTARCSGCGSPSAPSWQAPRAWKRRKASSVTRHGRHRTSAVRQDSGHATIFKLTRRSWKPGGFGGRAVQEGRCAMNLRCPCSKNEGDRRNLGFA
jgi:hypothetical protein